MFTSGEKASLYYEQKSNDLVIMASYLHLLLESVDIDQAAEAAKIRSLPLVDFSHILDALQIYTMKMQRQWILFLRRSLHTLPLDMFLLIGFGTGLILDT